MIDPELMKILVCPVDHGQLTETEDPPRLVCATCRRRYPIEDGIPVMLVDEAEGP